jgi:hypothetical protein
MKRESAERRIVPTGQSSQSNFFVAQAKAGRSSWSDALAVSPAEKAVA